MTEKQTHSLVVLMIEHEQPEGLSSRKLVVETAKHNVLTAYNSEEGLRLLDRFPNVDAVMVHGLLLNCEGIIAEVLKRNQDLPVIVATPNEYREYAGARDVVASHMPSRLLDLLAREFHVSISSD